MDSVAQNPKIQKPEPDPSQKPKPQKILALSSSKALVQGGEQLVEHVMNLHEARSLELTPRLS